MAALVLERPRLQRDRVLIRVVSGAPVRCSLLVLQRGAYQWEAVQDVRQIQNLPLVFSTEVLAQTERRKYTLGGDETILIVDYPEQPTPEAELFAIHVALQHVLG